MSTKLPSHSTLPDELCQSLRKRNVVLFIGAGLSVGAGLPNWKDLIQPLAKRLGYDGDNLLRIAQYYENRMGRHELLTYLRNNLNETIIKPTENHRLITQLPVNIIVTTNYDDLLERSFTETGKSFNKIVTEKELPYWDESRVNLIKIHGTLERPETIIVTEKDYNTISRKNGLLIQHIISLLSIKTFVFIGYSVSDPDFNQIYDILSIDLGKHQRRAYIVSFETDVFSIEALVERGFGIIQLSNESGYDFALTELLKSFLNCYTF